MEIIAMIMLGLGMLFIGGIGMLMVWDLDREFNRAFGSNDEDINHHTNEKG